uniref:Uncharacterized protein n=1 Tax=Knipowitschia caucasica TaxID=637954 RepID=A0AAV2K5B8_KNICA
MARREQGVLVEKLGQEDREDQRDPEGREGPEEQLENQEQRELLEVMALLVLLERGDCRGLKELTVSLDQKDLPDHQGKMGCLDILDREEKLDSKERWVLLDLLELSGLRVHLGRLAQWVSVATLDPLAPLESRVFLDPLEKKAPKEILVPLEALAKMAPQD